VKEMKPGSAKSFDGTVRDLETEMAESTATVTVSVANPMIARESQACEDKARQKGRAREEGQADEDLEGQARESQTRQGQKARPPPLRRANGGVGIPAADSSLWDCFWCGGKRSATPLWTCGGQRAQ
jgi:hypothetical protein